MTRNLPLASVAASGLRGYAAVMFSDVGSNSLLVHPDSFMRVRLTANRLDLVAEYVSSGGAFVMVGGYMSFAGIESKARYAGTAVERMLPVRSATSDDRVELPQGRPEVIRPDHPIMSGPPAVWPPILGYNRLTAKDDADVLVHCRDGPLLVVGTWERGRTTAFASDCGPHRAPSPFLDWEYHDCFCALALHWLCSTERD